MINDSKLEDCVKRFSREADIMAVWLFGSAAKEQMRADSDVDFGVLFFRDVVRPPIQYGHLISDLETILGRSVDLGKLDTRNLIYAHQAISEGRLVYDRAPLQTNQFVEKALALYFDLKQDRKVVEDAYCA